MMDEKQKQDLRNKMDTVIFKGFPLYFLRKIKESTILFNWFSLKQCFFDFITGYDDPLDFMSEDQHFDPLDYYKSYLKKIKDYPDEKDEYKDILLVTDFKGTDLFANLELVKNDRKQSFIFTKNEITYKIHFTKFFERMLKVLKDFFETQGLNLDDVALVFTYENNRYRSNKSDYSVELTRDYLYRDEIYSLGPDSDIYQEVIHLKDLNDITKYASIDGKYPTIKLENILLKLNINKD